jgi:ribose transport system substrate-binding protein/inositol transport system substrate-binding protein
MERKSFLRITIVPIVLAITVLGGGLAFSQAKAMKPYHLAFFIAHEQQPFMVNLANAIQSAGTAAGVNVKVYVADNDPVKQASQVESAISQKVDGIMLDACSFDGLGPAVQEAVDAKIPTITVHEGVVNQDILAAFVSPDLKVGGHLEMEQAVRDLKGKGDIAFMYGAMGHPAQIAITDGGKEVLAQNPGIKVVFEGSGKWVAPEALSLAENWLNSGKHLDAIVCNNDGMALGVLQALKAANEIGKIKLYGLDAPPDAMKAIKDGEETASIYNDPVIEGQKAIETMINVIEGRPVDKKVIITPVLITKQNVDMYYKP